MRWLLCLTGLSPVLIGLSCLCSQTMAGAGSSQEADCIKQHESGGAQGMASEGVLQGLQEEPQAPTALQGAGLVKPALPLRPRQRVGSSCRSLACVKAIGGLGALPTCQPWIPAFLSIPLLGPSTRRPLGNACADEAER